MSESKGADAFVEVSHRAEVRIGKSIQRWPAIAIPYRMLFRCGSRQFFSYTLFAPGVALITLYHSLRVTPECL